MDVEQIDVISQFLLIHKEQGAEAAIAWAAEQEKKLDDAARLPPPKLELVPKA